MYSELFQLKEPPFRLTPDPEFLFASKQHSRAKAYMESTIWLADGFVVITGEIGAGKTTLIESFLKELPDDVVLAHVSQTQLTPVEFLQAVLLEFGFKEFHDRKVELLSILKDFMVDQYTQGRTLLLIVDEAQNLSHKVLEELRLLSGIESQKEKPLRIILAGQPELSDKLDSLRLEQLRQRIRLRFHLSTLSKRETHKYVQHRLNVAGADGRKIFDKDSLDLVYRYAGGVPRLINVLCDTAMLCGFSEGKSTIDVGLISEAIKELQWVEYSKRYEDRGLYSSSAAAHAADSAGTTYEGEPPGSGVPARFDVLFKDQPITEFNLRMGRSMVGRTGDNDLQIRSRYVSRHHLQVTSDAERSTLEDLNSTNGTFIGSKRIKAHLLEDGDVIKLGQHKLVYRNLRVTAAQTDTASAPAESSASAESSAPAESSALADSPETPTASDTNGDSADVSMIDDAEEKQAATSPKRASRSQKKRKRSKSKANKATEKDDALPAQSRDYSGLETEVLADNDER